MLPDTSRFTSGKRARWDARVPGGASFARNNPASGTLTALGPLRGCPFTRGLRRVSRACRVHFNFVGTTPASSWAR